MSAPPVPAPNPFDPRVLADPWEEYRRAQRPALGLRFLTHHVSTEALVKFYDSLGPNPKLVRMFAAEKGVTFPQVEKVDIMAGANRQGPYLQKNPAGQLPSLELDDGRVIAETVAICEYLEDTKPKPALIGDDAGDRAETRMWTRRIEWKIVQPLADGFRFAEGLPLFKARIRTLPEAADGLKAIARDGLTWLDGQMAGRDTIVPKRFTLADIVLFAFLEFGGSVGQPLDPSLKTLAAWFEQTKARPSAKA
jgi:glutathione S-transferase